MDVFTVKVDNWLFTFNGRLLAVCPDYSDDRKNIEVKLWKTAYGSFVLWVDLKVGSSPLVVKNRDIYTIVSSLEDNAGKRMSKEVVELAAQVDSELRSILIC